MNPTSRILILDFGSQFTQLIARRLRELKVYCEIYPCDVDFKAIKDFKPQGIILSGGPYSVYDKKSPRLNNENLGLESDPKKQKSIFQMGIPILGICYGMQYLAQIFGAKVKPANAREYGRAELRPSEPSELMPWLKAMGKLQVWMSHGDEIEDSPNGFVITAKSHNGGAAAIEDSRNKIYAVQFHPEVAHTEKGKIILSHFALDICKAKPDWSMDAYLQEQVKAVQEKVGKSLVICGLSGGVDSSVAAGIVQKAIGKQLHCIFVNNGLLRKDEAKEVLEVYQKNMKLHVHYADASKLFLKRLKKVIDPEKKRKIIGATFIEVFEKEAKKIYKKHKGAQFLVQGTLYPDVIESVPPPRSVSGKTGKVGYSSTIKSHHNVGGLPKKMKFKLIEPLRELFKDEVRAMGKILGIPDIIIQRQPFPGPGLAVRVIGEITEERLRILREVDAIFIDAIRSAGLYNDIWQAFAAYLPIQSVGVMGDSRTYEAAVALRAVTSQDGMTADWYAFKPEFLASLSNKIIGQVRGVNRVVYDISSKPPATIEWE